MNHDNNHLIELNIIGVTHSQVQSGAFALILEETDGERRIPIVIGISEAQAIAMKLENVVAPRPVTHDLIATMMHAYGIELRRVVIAEFQNGVFRSDLYVTNGENEAIIDARTSDAIAIALRTGAKIFTTPQVIDNTGFVIKDNDIIRGVEARKASQRPIEELSVEELSERLQNAVEEENYELAAKIQQIIKGKARNED